MSSSRAAPSIAVPIFLLVIAAIVVATAVTFAITFAGPPPRPAPRPSHCAMPSPRCAASHYRTRRRPI